MIIYKAVNKVTGKIYIGQTTRTLKQRLMEHFCPCKTNYFTRALRKYGKDGFEITVLEECTSLDQLNEREIHWVNFYNSMSPSGYNLTQGGGGIKGHKHTAETKEKLRLLHKGKKKPSVAIRNAQMRGDKHPQYGKKQTEEQKQKRSLSMLGKNLGKIHLTQKKWSEESRKRYSEKLKETGGIWLGKKRPTHSIFMMGEGNPSKRAEVNAKRSETITMWWKERKENRKCALL